MTEAQISNLERVVEHQSKMTSIWSEPVDRKRTIQETVLLAALRHLHAIVENDPDTAFLCYRKYWDIDSELQINEGD